MNKPSEVLFPPNRLVELSLDTLTVFLAGSIDMGKAQEWQKEVCDTLTGCLIFNPRRVDWDSSWKQEMSNPKFKEQVDWELDHLVTSDIALFFFDPNGKAPVTLLELGTRGYDGDTVVVCPEGYWRRGNVEIFCNRYSIPMFSDLKSGIGHVQAMVDMYKLGLPISRYPLPIDQLLEYVKTNYQTATRTVMIAVEGPTVGGVWCVDLTDLTMKNDADDGKHIVIEWSTETGFRLSDITGENGICEEQEVFDTIELLQQRISELLKDG